MIEAVGILACPNILDQLKFRLFFSHAWFAHSVLCRDGKFLLIAQGSWSFGLSKYSQSIGLQIVSLGKHDVQCLFYAVMENSCSRQLEFWLVQIFLINWNSDCSVSPAVFAMSVLCRDGKLLLEAVGILVCPNILDQLD